MNKEYFVKKTTIFILIILPIIIALVCICIGRIGISPSEVFKAIAGSEDFFISLYDDEAVEVEQKDVLKQMLALLLERKRILRPKGRPEGGFQLYLHPSSKREFLVPQKELSEELVFNIQSQINAFLV